MIAVGECILYNKPMPSKSASSSHKSQSGHEKEDHTETEEFKAMMEKILLAERILLHTLSFDVSVVHPHNGTRCSWL